MTSVDGAIESAAGADLAPALLPGLALIATERGIVVRGGPRTVLLPPSVVAVSDVRRLREGLSGTMTFAEATDHLGVDARRLVDDLLGAGLIDHSTDDGFDRASSVGRHYRRVLGHNAGGGADEHARRLRSAVVVLFGAFAGHADRIRRQLTEIGVRAGVATSGDQVEQAPGWGEPDVRRRLVVLDCSRASGRDREHLRAVADRAAQAGVPVLYTAAGAHHLLGPLTVTSSPPCPDCIVRSLAEADEPIADQEVIAAVAAAQIANEVSRIVGALGDSTRLMSVVRTRADQLRATRFGVLSYPDCLRCQPLIADRGAWSGFSVAALDAAGQRPPRAWELDDRLSNAELRARWATAHERGRWEARPGRALDELAKRDDAPDSRRIDADAVRLTTLLEQASPARGLDPQREQQPPGLPDFVPVQLFVVSTADPFGLSGSVFQFDDQRRAVEAVSARELAPGASSSRDLLDRLRPTSSVAIVLSATVARLARHHADDALRLAHLAVGVTLAHVRAAVENIDCVAELDPAWDENLHQYLGVASAQDCIAAIAIVTDRTPRCP